VPSGEVAGAELLGQHQIRVRALGADGRQHVERHLAGCVDGAGLPAAVAALVSLPTLTTLASGAAAPLPGGVAAAGVLGACGPLAAAVRALFGHLDHRPLVRSGAARPV